MHSHIETISSRTFCVAVISFILLNIVSIVVSFFFAPLSTSVLRLSACSGSQEINPGLFPHNCSGADLSAGQVFSFETPALDPLVAHLRILGHMAPRRADFGLRTHINMSVEVESAASGGTVIYSERFLRHLTCNEGDPLGDRMVLFHKDGVRGVYRVRISLPDLPADRKPWIGDWLFDIETTPPSFSLFQAILRAILAVAAVAASLLFIIAYWRALRRATTLRFVTRASFEGLTGASDGGFDDIGGSPQLSLCESLREAPQNMFVLVLLVATFLLVNPAYAVRFVMSGPLHPTMGAVFVALFFFLVLLHVPWQYGPFLLNNADRRARLEYYVPRVVVASLFFAVHLWALIWNGVHDQADPRTVVVSGLPLWAALRTVAFVLLLVYLLMHGYAMIRLVSMMRQKDVSSRRAQSIGAVPVRYRVLFAVQNACLLLLCVGHALLAYLPSETDSAIDEALSVLGSSYVFLIAFCAVPSSGALRSRNPLDVGSDGSFVSATYTTAPPEISLPPMLSAGPALPGAMDPRDHRRFVLDDDNGI